MSLGIWQYIKELKDTYKIFTNKQKKFLSHIAIYTKDLEVYKVIIWKDPRKKNGRRVGVVDDIKIYEKGKNKELLFPKLKKELEGSEGYKIFMYDTKMDTVNCYEGEIPQLAI
jgi:ABC-type molybdate transport system substrate-binding protein